MTGSRSTRSTVPPTAVGGQILHPRGMRWASAPRALGPRWRVALGSAGRSSPPDPGEYDLRLLSISSAGRGRRGRRGLGRRGATSCGGGGALDDGCLRVRGADVAYVRIRWDSRRERVEGERELVKVWEKGLDGRRLGGRTEAWAWSSRGGSIVMRGRGRETTAVLAPDARLASRALAAST